ncbi:putative ethylene response sensor 1 [Wolffia australiana]
MEEACCPCPRRELMNYQYISDFFIVLAYFSIPLELIYFVKKSSFFPYRWVLIQFGAFIVLCGATHLINLWTQGPHSENLDRVMTAAKVSTAVISCATALMLVHVIPDLLSAKMREFFLKMRAEELDRVMGIMRKEKDLERDVRVLVQEIRAPGLDPPAVLRAAMAGLARTFALEECAFWTPSPSALELRLSHTLRHQTLLGSAVSADAPAVSRVCLSNQAVRIPHTSPLARICPSLGRYVPPEVVAVRVPLPPSDRPVFAVLVLMLPADSAMRWRPHELDLLPAVADQIAAALAQAALFEEAARAADQLLAQSLALDQARRAAERAADACRGLLAVVGRGLRTPLQSLLVVSSLLLEQDLAPQPRIMAETLRQSGGFMAALLGDVFESRRQLEPAAFDLPSFLRDVVAMVRPVAAVKNLSLSLAMAPDLPSSVSGDRNRLATVILHLAGNAVKFSRQGSVVVAASVATDARLPDCLPPASNSHFYLRITVQDTGCGFRPQDLPRLFEVSAGGLGLALCRRLVSLMGGQIWLESEGPEQGCTAVFLVKLGRFHNPTGPVDSMLTEGTSLPRATWHQRIS